MAGGTLCVASYRKEVEKITTEVKKTILDWNEDVLTVSRENFVPKKTWLLYSTSKKEIVESTHNKFSVMISYGNNGQAPYAKWVELLPYHHNIGTDHYLSKPFNLMSSRLTFNLEQLKL